MFPYLLKGGKWLNGKDLMTQVFMRKCLLAEHQALFRVLAVQ